MSVIAARCRWNGRTAAWTAFTARPKAAPSSANWISPRTPPPLTLRLPGKSNPENHPGMSIKIGVVGAGGMLRYHAAGFRSAGAELVAICDVNLEAARKAAARENIPAVFGSVDKMLK